MNILFKDSAFSDQLKRVLGYTAHKGADIGECLITASLIHEGDYISWYDQWTLLANRITREAEASKLKEHYVSAYQAYLRASHYYRTAFFFLRHDITQEHIKHTLVRSRNCFMQAMELAPYRCRFVEIPFGDIKIPGYWYTPSNKKQERKTLICITGYDGAAEEFYCTGVKAALDRGYNCLTFDGPGQGRMLIEREVHMRPDWERVITPIIDYLITLPEVDQKCIALMGRSVGGYFAARAATREQRIAALIVDPGILDLGTRTLAMLPTLIRKSYVNKQRSLVDGFFNSFFRINKKRTFFFKSRMAAHGITSVYDYISLMQNYTVVPYVQDIQCPTLVCDNDSDKKGSGQSHEFFQALSCPKQYIVFTEQEGAGQHCEVLAPLLFEQKAFDWLDEMLSSVAKE